MGILAFNGEVALTFNGMVTVTLNGMVTVTFNGWGYLHVIDGGIYL